MSKPLNSITFPVLGQYHLVAEWDNIKNKPDIYEDENGNLVFNGAIKISKIILGSESFGPALPETGVEGQLFILIPQE